MNLNGALLDFFDQIVGGVELLTDQMHFIGIEKHGQGSSYSGAPASDHGHGFSPVKTRVTVYTVTDAPAKESFLLF